MSLGMVTKKNNCVFVGTVGTAVGTAGFSVGTVGTLYLGLFLTNLSICSPYSPYRKTTRPYGCPYSPYKNTMVFGGASKTIGFL